MPQRFVAPIQHIAHASLTSIRSALSAASGGRRFDGTADPDEFSTLQLVVTPSPEEGEWAEPAITFDLVGSGKLRIDVLAAIRESPSHIEEDLRQLAKGYCDERHIELTSTWSWEKHGYDFYQAIISLPSRGTTAAQAYQAAADLHALCQQFLNHEYSTAMVRSLLRGGRPDLLVGQYESRWLECKSSAYDLSSPRDRIELAQDVARFANSEGDGLLVIGLKTKRDTNGDRIVSVHPLATPSAARYHKILDQMIYPPIDGLRVDVTPSKPAGTGALVVVYVPPQPEELKPFLVAGAFVHGKVEGAFISIVQRRDEHSIPTSPVAIHTALSVGRALLRRGRLPKDEPEQDSDLMQPD